MLITRDHSGNLSTSVYRKPTYSGLYLQWNSFVPRQYKRGLVNCLIHRAWNICSSYDNFCKELEFIRSVLTANGYPLNFIESCVKRYLDKKYQDKTCESLPVFGPEKKSVTLCLPFVGNQGQILQRQLKRMVSAITPWVNLRIIFTPVFKLTTLTKLKCPIPVLSQSNVVYKIDCKECSNFYIGKTYRILSQRVKEHGTSESSALTKHSIETGHIIDFDNPQVLCKDLLHNRLLIKESLKIKEYSAHKSLNGNMGSFDLMLF